MSGSFNHHKVFNWIEYIVFFGMLSGSALIGLYYAYFARKKNNTDEYLLGGRKMPQFPVTMSLIVSFVSGITLLGFPAEMYSYGTQLFGITIAIAISVVLLNLFYLPVFYEIQAKSLYEYLEKRFNKNVRFLASFIFAFSLLLYIPVVIYVPALAFNQVTGLSIEILAPIICSICVFYTSIGGLKAVVWSDALQSVFTIGSMIAVIILGCTGVGGISTIIKASSEGERLELFNMDPNPFVRNTFWTTAIGSIPIHLNIFATHPGSVQRYISLPSYKQARIVTIAMFFGVVMMKAFSTFTGLIIYTKYKDCDLIITGEVKKPGQLLPYYVMDVGGEYQGLPGLFLSGVVSTALSTMSTGLNTVAGTIFEDFLKPILPYSINEKKSNLILKIIVIILGILCTLSVFIIQKLGTIMQIALSLQGITAGTSIFMFTFGLFIPWGNSKGVIAGALTGVLTTATIATGGHIYSQNGGITYERKVTSIESCPSNMTNDLPYNTTTFGYPGEGTKVIYTDDVPYIFRVSYLYYSLIGLSVSMAVGCIVSKLTGGQDTSLLDPRLVIPQLRSRLPTRTNLFLNKYSKVAANENVG